MPKAILVRKDNLEYIKEYARECGLNLDYIDDVAEYNAEDGYETYVVTDGSVETNNVVFTEMIETDFNDHWKFIQAQNPNLFVPITHH